ncbi:MAG: 30S ribosomal protein S6 [Clostridium sp.]|nr:30S ribosomal protein S6 [Clostridium sp.]
MNKYEIMFIVKPDLEETAIKNEAESLKKVLTNLEAKIVEEKVMGQRELAYEIKKYKNGYYFLFVVEGSHEAIKEFDRLAGINENILRHLIIRKED